MALEATFRSMLVRLQRLNDDLLVLRLTLGDKPPGSESALVDQLENTVLDMTGLLQEALDSSREAQRVVRWIWIAPGGRLPRVRIVFNA